MARSNRLEIVFGEEGVDQFALTIEESGRQGVFNCSQEARDVFHERGGIHRYARLGQAVLQEGAGVLDEEFRRPLDVFQEELDLLKRGEVIDEGEANVNQRAPEDARAKDERKDFTQTLLDVLGVERFIDGARDLKMAQKALQDHRLAVGIGAVGGFALGL